MANHSASSDLSDLSPLSDRLLLVNSPTQGKFPLGFSFLVLGTDTHALIDTGCGEDVCRRIDQEHGIDLVINSHCHPDHVSGNHLFAGKELLVPEQRMDEVGAVKRLARRLLGPDPEVMQFWEGFVRQHLGLDDYVPTKTFCDGQVLDFGGISLQAVHTPGHLDDHYCFFEPKENIMLTFDIDMTGFGPFYGNPEADIGLFKNSIVKIADMAPTVAASSHRLPVAEGGSDNVRKELLAFADKFDRNERRVTRALGQTEQPRSLDEICDLKPVYGKYTPGLETILAYFEKHMVLKHLAQMEETGRVSEQGGKYILNS